MRELLVRYLLGELNSQEQEQLEAQLRDSPELRRELEYLRACFSGGSDDLRLRRREHGAPRRATPRAASPNARSIAFAAIRTLRRYHTQLRPKSPPLTISPPGTPSWSLADLTVAGGVFLAISMLFLPALRQSRDAARRTGCANNLRQARRDARRAIPRPRATSSPRRPATKTPASSPSICSRKATPARTSWPGCCCAVRRPRPKKSPTSGSSIRVPTMCELEAATAKERCMWKRSMSPQLRLSSWASSKAIATARSATNTPAARPLLADAPCDKLDNRSSANHGGLGQNVLYQDGHVGFQKSSNLPADQQRRDLSERRRRRGRRARSRRHRAWPQRSHAGNQRAQPSRSCATSAAPLGNSRTLTRDLRHVPKSTPPFLASLKTLVTRSARCPKECL